MDATSSQYVANRGSFDARFGLKFDAIQRFLVIASRIWRQYGQYNMEANLVCSIHVTYIFYIQSKDASVLKIGLAFKVPLLIIY